MERNARSIDEAFAIAVLLLCRIVADLVRSNGFPHLQLEWGEAKAKAKQRKTEMRYQIARVGSGRQRHQRRA
jgi:hypothetical protein